MADPRFIWPVTVVATVSDGLSEAQQNLRFDEGGGELTAAIALGDWFIRGGGAAGTDLLQQIATKMTAAGGQVYTVTRSTTGRVTIAAPGAFTLRWNTGTAPLFDGAVIGFSTAANDTGTNTYTSDNQHRFGWYPEQRILDGNRRMEDAIAGGLRSLGNQQWVQQWQTDYHALARIDWVRVAKIRYGNVDGTVVGTLHETLTSNQATTWRGFYDAARLGIRFEFHPDTSVIASATAVIDPGTPWMEDIEEAATLLMDRGERYRVVVPMRPYTT